MANEYGDDPESCEWCGLPVQQDPNSPRTRWVHRDPCFAMRRAFKDLAPLGCTHPGAQEAIDMLRELAVKVARDLAGKS